MFSRIFDTKKNPYLYKQRVLVLNFVEISEDFLIFIDLKITETRFTSASVFRSEKKILSAVSMPHVHMHTLKLCAHLLFSYEYDSHCISCICFK